MGTSTTKQEGLLVCDIMRGNIVSLPWSATMREAGEAFFSNEISAAPVVDAMGRCIGVLSAMDFVRWLQKADDGEPCRHRREIESTPDRGGRMRAAEMGPCEWVTCHMSTAVQTVAADSTLADAIRIMLSSHLHHLVALDAHARPLGWVSALDILATVGEDGDASSRSPNLPR